LLNLKGKKNLKKMETVNGEKLNLIIKDKSTQWQDPSQPDGITSIIDFLPGAAKIDI